MNLLEEMRENRSAYELNRKQAVENAICREINTIIHTMRKNSKMGSSYVTYNITNEMGIPYLTNGEKCEILSSLVKYFKEQGFKVYTKQYSSIDISWSRVGVL